MLSPISRLNQSIQSPKREMESIQRIGHPSPPPSRGKNDANGEKNQSTATADDEPTYIAPSLFGLPSKTNYHSSTGFGKQQTELLCLVVISLVPFLHSL